MPTRAPPLCLPAMAPRDYHELLWETVAPGLEPEAFTVRREFLLAHVEAGQSALDVGCGEGLFSAALLDAGLSVIGIDVAEEPLRRGRAARADLDLRVIDSAAAWPLQDASFDVVWAGEVIEHVHDTAGWLSEVRRVLRPKATLLISTPNHTPLGLARLAFDRRAFARHFDPRADHLRFYSAGTLTSILEDFGFDLVSVSGAGGRLGARTTLLARARRGRW